jgi:hypothetical protein
MRKISSNLKVLFVGDMWYGSNARSMKEGFESIGAQVRYVDTTSLSNPRKLSPPWFYKRAMNGERLPSLKESMTQKIITIAKDFRPDILFVFKGIYLNQEAILNIPGSIKIHYSPDDASNPSNLTDEYLEHERHWDLVVTTKSFNVTELLQRGAKAALYVKSAYDPRLHYPTESHNRSWHKFQLGFIGNRRLDRRALLLNLASRYRQDFYLAGPGWWKDSISFMGAGVLPRPARFGDAYSDIVSKISVNLVLLNSDNRDLHTCRTFEVPAAGGLILAQNTSEHREIYRGFENELLFEDENELIQKHQNLMGDPEKSSTLRTSLNRSILEGENSYSDRALQILGTTIL